MRDTFAQGDLLFIELKDSDRQADGTFYVPELLDNNKFSVGEAVKLESGKLIVGHSETGHHHYFQAGPVIEAGALLSMTSVPLTTVFKTDKMITLNHDRPSHPHPPVEIPQGSYVVRRQQEFRPEGWKAVVD